MGCSIEKAEAQQIRDCEDFYGRRFDSLVWSNGRLFVQIVNERSKGRLSVIG